MTDFDGSDDELNEEEEDDEYGEEEEPKDDPDAKLHANIDAKIKADDLLYNMNEDDKNEKWVNQNLRKTASGRSTDAVLNCPCCFTPLCYDCQRHDTYKNQYRAMFTVNCDIDYTQILKYGKSKRKRNTVDIPTGEAEDLYNPVKCRECGTEVAVYDKDEVYHFFNVFPSDS